MKKIKEICNQIKINRENKKKSIDEVASILKIKTELLILIEAGKFQTIVYNIYSKGHIRTYLEWLGIDSKQLFDLLKEKSDYKVSFKKKHFTTPVFYASKKYIVLICVIILFVVANSWNKLFLKDIYRSSSQEEEHIDYKEKNYQYDQKIKTNSPNEIRFEGKAKTSVVSLEATSDSWIQIERLDGSIYASKILKEGEKIIISDEKDLILITNNAGGIVIKVKDIIIKPLGEIGMIKRDISLNPNDLLKIKNN